MNPKFLQFEERHRQLQERLADTGLAGTPEYQSLGREFKRLSAAVTKIQTLRSVEEEVQKSEPLAASADAELRQLAEEELAALRPRVAALNAELEEFLIPRDPRDDRDVIIEIRAGTGGDEAALFVGDLYRMYTRYAAGNSFSVDPYSSTPTGLGGYKDITFAIKGEIAFGRFKFESGVHRVQRVPATEASGRVHTSTATVAVLPEAEDVDVDINPADVRTDVYRASGAGGQHVNKTESAVRLTHVPTNTVVACQDERSQMKNKAKAWSMLRAKIYQAQEERLALERRDMRRALVGSGERNEKIRTYNFSQDRVTDHRINQNFHNLPGILEGNLDGIFTALRDADKKERLAALGQNP